MSIAIATIPAKVVLVVLLADKCKHVLSPVSQ